MRQPLRIVTFRWGEAYSAQHINVLRSMFARHLHVPHEFVAIVDDPAGIEPDIRVVRLWRDPRLIGHCMIRIKAFDRSMRELIGPRFAWVDLDVVLTGDVTPIFDRDEPFVACGVELPWQPYNGSVLMMDAGARQHVYDRFTVGRFAALREKHGYGDGDQGWIACALGPDEPRWTTADGIYSYRDHCEKDPPDGTGGALPEGARLVILNAKRFDPADPVLQRRSPWIAEHWR